MARKKRAEEASAGSPWLNTFADLMNLLLCFFVLLFASSTVDAEKYDMIVTSLSSNFSIFSGGGSALDYGGNMISSGISQLNNLENYYYSIGKSSDESTDNVNEKTAEDIILEKLKEASEVMYDEISDLAGKGALTDLIDLSIDPNYQFVKISLSGSILFDPGKADIKAEALPVFSKVGDILTVYNDFQIEIEGHTDNVPMTSDTYPDNNWLSSARALNAAVYLIEEKGIDPRFLKWTGRGEYEPIASNDTSIGKAKNRRVEIKIYTDINK